MKCFEYLLKGKDIVAVLATGFGKSLLFQLLPDFVPVKVDNNIVKNGVNYSYTASTVRDIYTFACVFCSVTRPSFASLVFMKGTSCCVVRSIIGEVRRYTVLW